MPSLLGSQYSKHSCYVAILALKHKSAYFEAALPTAIQTLLLNTTARGDNFEEMTKHGSTEVCTYLDASMYCFSIYVIKFPGCNDISYGSKRSSLLYHRSYLCKDVFM